MQDQHVAAIASVSPGTGSGAVQQIILVGQCVIKAEDIRLQGSDIGIVVGEFVVRRRILVRHTGGVQILKTGLYGQALDQLGGKARIVAQLRRPIHNDRTALTENQHGGCHHDDQQPDGHRHQQLNQG